MTTREALKIIKVDEISTHVYRLICKTCGKFVDADTDSPNDLLLKMAERHRNCVKEGKDEIQKGR